MLTACLLPHAEAQDEAAAADASTYRLHVYEDLVQLPSVVLSPLRESIMGLKSTEFNLRLDSGPIFHPSHVRLQGDDEMSITVLLDTPAGLGYDLPKDLKKFAPAMHKDVFRQKDNVSVVTANCNRTVTVTMPTPSVQALQRDVDAVLKNASVPGPDCKRGFPLWDAIGKLAVKLQDAPGRRVILVISPGEDSGSRITLEQLRTYVNHYGITIMGIRLDTVSGYALRRPILGGVWSLEPEDPFELLCAETGGVVTKAESGMIWLRFQALMDLLRNRYILEFKRPVNEQVGLHQIDVDVKGKRAIVRVSGIGIPVRDSTRGSDPNTVPTDNSDAPVIGDRKILPKPQSP